MANETPTMLAAPVAQQERITILDSLRGIAILGILLMNIPGFGLPEVQTSDPSVLNETGINYKTWYIVDWALAGNSTCYIFYAIWRRYDPVYHQA